ncbi:hypothetical protein MKY51_14140 [Solibacillus sp. FSL R5-0691]|uniref:hypothetical protein n=1 Tax=unclassified Solibacillus TaxID=2637870 RepID=UPI0030CD6E39
MYFRRYEEAEKNLERAKKLLKRFEVLSLINKEFTLNEIEGIFERKYLAKEIENDPTYMGLMNDPMVNVNNIVKMYSISEPNILEGLYTEEERQTQNVLANEEFIAETESELLSVKIMEGKLIRIALESTDGHNLSGFTQQGECKKIAAELFVVGAKVTEEDIDINDAWFQEYLEALVLSGYLSDL